MDTLTVDHVVETTLELQRGQATDVIAIHFRRDPRTTGGPGECAWCDIDGQRIEILPKKSGNNGGAVYRLVVLLAKAGHSGRAFETHDGHKVCLRGAIDLGAVPRTYGGERKS